GRGRWRRGRSCTPARRCRPAGPCRDGRGRTDSGGGGRGIVGDTGRTIASQHRQGGAMSLYDIPINRLDGTPSSLAEFQGKAVPAGHVASKCGLTPQYEQLEKLQKDYGDKGFSVVGFPSNQFLGQEPGTAEE